MTIRPATLRDACYIAANLRHADRREIEAVMPGWDATRLAAWSLHLSGENAHVAYLRGQPVAAMGLVPMHPGVASWWAWGTDRMKRVIPEATRFCRASWASLPGLRRIEVRTAIDHDLSHRWLAALGAKPEGIARQYGQGLDFVVFALTKD